MGFENKLNPLRSTFAGGQNPSFEWFHNGSKLGRNMITMGTGLETQVFFLKKTLATQGIYQLFASSNVGRIFGREIRVEFIGKMIYTVGTFNAFWVTFITTTVITTKHPPSYPRMDTKHVRLL